MKSSGKVKLHVRKGDIVSAISGSDKSSKKTGKVLQVLPEQGKAIVEGFNYIKKHQRPTQDNQQGGIIEKEAPIDVSNLKVVKRSSEGGASTNKKKASDNKDEKATDKE